MSCAYLYVHNFPRTRVSRSRGRGIRGRRENLASDKETAEATRNSLSGRGLTAKDAKNAKGGWRNPASSAKTEADYAGAGGETAQPSTQRTRRSQREDWGSGNDKIRSGEWQRENLVSDKETVVDDRWLRDWGTNQRGTRNAEWLANGPVALRYRASLGGRSAPKGVQRQTWTLRLATLRSGQGLEIGKAKAVLGSPNS